MSKKQRKGMKNKESLMVTPSVAITIFIKKKQDLKNLKNLLQKSILKKGQN